MQMMKGYKQSIDACSKPPSVDLSYARAYRGRNASPARPHAAPVPELAAGCSVDLRTRNFIHAKHKHHVRACVHVEEAVPWKGLAQKTCNIHKPAQKAWNCTAVLRLGGTFTSSSMGRPGPVERSNGSPSPCLQPHDNINLNRKFMTPPDKKSKSYHMPSWCR